MASRTMILLALSLSLSLPLLAVEPDLPPVPDPFGLGPRLALIDHLQQQYGVRPPEGASLDELRELYSQQLAAKAPNEEVIGANESAFERAASVDRMRRLRAELKRAFGIETTGEEDEARLAAMLRTQQEQRRQEVLTSARNEDGKVAAGTVPGQPGAVVAADDAMIRDQESGLRMPAPEGWATSAADQAGAALRGAMIIYREARQDRSPALMLVANIGQGERGIEDMILAAKQGDVEGQAVVSAERMPIADRDGFRLQLRSLRAGVIESALSYHLRAANDDWLQVTFVCLDADFAARKDEFAGYASRIRVVGRRVADPAAPPAPAPAPPPAP